MPNTTGRDHIKIRSPQDAVSAVPYLLGFHPSNSLVAIGFDGPHNTCAMRLDLPHPNSAERIATLLSRNQFRQALLLGYGDEPPVTQAINAARTALDAQQISVKEALRISNGRWWSYLCADPRCCPPEGTPYDISTSVVAAQATLAGQVAYQDRAALTQTVAPLTGPARAAMRQATDQAEERFLTLATLTPDPTHLRAVLIAEAIPFLNDLTTRLTDHPSDDEIAWLGVLLTNLRIRDEAWVRIDVDSPGPHISFWRNVLRRVEEPYAAAPACLLAYVAYTTGDGGLANVALDRAFEADPAYTLAGLLRDLMLAGVPPTKARLHMTPAQLANAYQDQDPPEPHP